MTLDYLLTKRSIHILDWLQQHDINSVEDLHKEIGALGLEPASDKIIAYVELLTKPISEEAPVVTILPEPVKTSKKKAST